MYNASNDQGGGETNTSSNAGNPEDEVTDVDFEEVNDKK
jgi:hypothetical protein